MTAEALKAVVDSARLFTLKANTDGDPRPEPPDDGDALPVPEWVRSMRLWQPTIRELGWRHIEPQHAVQGLIRVGKVGTLVAAGGTGKTTLLLMLAICHATGRQFLGLDVTVGTFVLISGDDPQEDLEDALELVMQAMKLDASEVNAVRARVRVHSLQGESGVKTFARHAHGSIQATGLEEYVIAAFEGITDLVGVALDTLRQFSGGSSNDEEVIKLTVAGATEIARRTGAYIILPHHTGKQNYRDGVQDMYCGSGSAAIADNCRFVLLLQTARWTDIESKVRRTGKERGDPLVLMSTRGSLLMRPAEPIFLHRDNYFIGRIAGATLTREQQEDEKDREVVRAVRGGARSKNAINAVVTGKKTNINARIDNLVRRGHLIEGGSQSSSPGYVVSASGARLLEPTR
jgi:RecA-family ATPase